MPIVVALIGILGTWKITQTQIDNTITLTTEQSKISQQRSDREYEFKMIDLYIRAKDKKEKELLLNLIRVLNTNAASILSDLLKIDGTVPEAQIIHANLLKVDDLLNHIVEKALDNAYKIIEIYESNAVLRKEIINKIFAQISLEEERTKQRNDYSVFSLSKIGKFECSRDQKETLNKMKELKEYGPNDQYTKYVDIAYGNAKINESE